MLNSRLIGRKLLMSLDKESKLLKSLVKSTHEAQLQSMLDSSLLKLAQVRRERI